MFANLNETLCVLIESNFRVAELSVSTYLPRWTNRFSETDSVRKWVLVHFNIINSRLCKTVTDLALQKKKSWRSL